MSLSFPIVVNATLVLTGMLGLRLQIPDGNGGTKQVETSVPFNLTNLNPVIHVSNDGQSNGNGIVPVNPNQNAKAPSRPSSFTQSTTFPPSYNHGKDCGTKFCNSIQVCVKWELQGQSRVHYECLENDGKHYTKINPTNPKSLCPSGQTHSIIPEQRPCLNDKISCDLIWKYKCVNVIDSPHSCNLKRCPSKEFICLESVHCGLEPPCITMVECHHETDIITYNKDIHSGGTTYALQ